MTIYILYDNFKDKISSFTQSRLQGITPGSIVKVIITVIFCQRPIFLRIFWCRLCEWKKITMIPLKTTNDSGMIIQCYRKLSLPLEALFSDIEVVSQVFITELPDYSVISLLSSNAGKGDNVNSGFRPSKW